MDPRSEDFFDEAKWRSEAVRWGMLEGDREELLEVVKSDGERRWHELPAVRRIVNRINHSSAIAAYHEQRRDGYRARIAAIAPESAMERPSPLPLALGALATSLAVLAGVIYVMWTGWEQSVTPHSALSALLSLTCGGLLLVELRRRAGGAQSPLQHATRAVPAIATIALILMLAGSVLELTLGTLAFALVATGVVVVAVAHLRDSAIDVGRQMSGAWFGALAAYHAFRCAHRERIGAAAQTRYDEWLAVFADQLERVRDTIRYEYGIGCQCGLWRDAVAGPMGLPAAGPVYPLRRTVVNAVNQSSESVQ